MGSKLNSQLSEKGIALAHAKGASLKAQGFAPDRVYTSELDRAKQTALIILQGLGVKIEIIELAALNERDFGQYDSKPYRYVLEAFDKYGENPPTVERVEPFVQRVTGALEQIKRETTGTTLVVTHSNPVMVMQAAICNPDNLNRFWEIGDPVYCEGFSYEI